jgi:hypothetical protein
MTAYTVEHDALDAAAAASCWAATDDPADQPDADYAAVTAYANDYHCTCRLPHAEQVQR